MKKSIIIYSAIFTAIVGLLWACSDSFLEQEPRGILSEGTITNADGTEAALIGAYAMLDGYNTTADTWSANPHNWIMGSITTDDAYKGSEQTDFPEITQLEIYQWTAGNSIINDKWVASYEGVVRVNNTLKLLSGSEDVTEANKTRIEGEAKFLRAYFHFELYKTWGNVPYFTEEDEVFIKSNVDVDPLSKAITDMETAVELLPESQAERGRADKFAARAMLGKFYMYRYGDTGNMDDVTKAKTQLDIVVNNKTLAPCLKDIFQLETENHEASLFSVQASMEITASGRNANWLNQLAYPAGPEFGCCGFHQPSQDLVNAYKVDANGLPLFDSYNNSNLNPSTDVVDPRIDLTIGRDDVPFLDWGVHAPNWIRDRAFSGPYSPKKFTHYKSDNRVTGGWNNNANNAINFPIIRLADAILLLAEAEVLLGNLPRAEELVNMIRERAGNCAQGQMYSVAGTDTTALKGSAVIIRNTESNPDAINYALNTWATYDVEPYPVGTFETQGTDYAMNAVRWERRLELALEGHRLFDLRRWGTAEEVLNAFVEFAAQTRSYYDDAATYTDKHRWFPIPTPQIVANTIDGEPILKQNLGF